MATTGVFNGSNLLVKVIGDGGTLATIGHTTSCSMSLSHDLPEATTKDSNGYSEFISGVRGGTISFEGLVAYDDSANAEEIIGYVTGRNKVDWSFGTAASGDTVYEGEGFISSIEVSAEMESPVSFSGEITITGAISSSTNV
jgi:predicted secreted protein